VTSPQFLALLSTGAAGGSKIGPIRLSPPYRGFRRASPLPSTLQQEVFKVGGSWRSAFIHTQLYTNILGVYMVYNTSRHCGHVMYVFSPFIVMPMAPFLFADISAR